MSLRKCSTYFMALALGFFAFTAVSCSDDEPEPKGHQLYLPVTIYPTVYEQIGGFDGVTLYGSESGSELTSWNNRASSTLLSFLESNKDGYKVYNYTSCGPNSAAASGCNSDHPQDQQVMIQVQVNSVKSSSWAEDAYRTDTHKECTEHDELVCREYCETSCYEYDCVDEYTTEWSDEEGDYVDVIVTSCTEECTDTCYLDHDDCWYETVVDECHDVVDYYPVTDLFYRASSSAHLLVTHYDARQNSTVTVLSKDYSASNTTSDRKEGHGHNPEASREASYTKTIFDGMISDVKSSLSALLNTSYTTERLDLDSDITLINDGSSVVLSMNMPAKAFANTYEVRIYDPRAASDSDPYAFNEFLPVTRSTHSFSFSYDAASFYSAVGNQGVVYIAIYSNNNRVGGIVKSI